MAEATEIVTLTLKDPADGQNPRLRKSLATIINQGHPYRMYVGPQVEHPKVQSMFIDWPSIEKHMEFTKYE
jgi:hypothetical protein